MCQESNGIHNRHKKRCVHSWKRDSIYCWQSLKKSKYIGKMFSTKNEEMPGHQSKYDHMRDRTYLRPRDMIKFCNCALDEFKRRKTTEDNGAREKKIDNVDVHNARLVYSEYLLQEIDDEVHKHLPDYERHLDVIRALGKWQFDRNEYEQALEEQYRDCPLTVGEALERLYDFSFIGFYRAGGRGFGGSEYYFRYREGRVNLTQQQTGFVYILD